MAGPFGFVKSIFSHLKARRFNAKIKDTRNIAITSHPLQNPWNTLTNLSNGTPSQQPQAGVLLSLIVVALGLPTPQPTLARKRASSKPAVPTVSITKRTAFISTSISSG